MEQIKQIWEKIYQISEDVYSKIIDFLEKYNIPAWDIDQSLRDKNIDPVLLFIGANAFIFVLLIYLFFPFGAPKMISIQASLDGNPIDGTVIIQMPDGTTQEVYLSNGVGAIQYDFDPEQSYTLIYKVGDKKLTSTATCSVSDNYCILEVNFDSSKIRNTSYSSAGATSYNICVVPQGLKATEIKEVYTKYDGEMTYLSKDRNGKYCGPAPAGEQIPLFIKFSDGTTKKTLINVNEDGLEIPINVGDLSVSLSDTESKTTNTTKEVTIEFTKQPNQVIIYKDGASYQTFDNIDGLYLTTKLPIGEYLIKVDDYVDRLNIANNTGTCHFDNNMGKFKVNLNIGNQDVNVYVLKELTDRITVEKLNKTEFYQPSTNYYISINKKGYESIILKNLSCDYALNPSSFEKAEYTLHFKTNAKADETAYIVYGANDIPVCISIGEDCYVNRGTYKVLAIFKGMYVTKKINITEKSGKTIDVNLNFDFNQYGSVTIIVDRDSKICLSNQDYKFNECKSGRIVSFYVKYGIYNYVKER
jgi:hypothetical protein